MPTSLKNKKVLLSPLDWGLGHATRCIPIINTLLENDNEVIIAADKGSYALLKQAFPQLEFFRLPGYDITYPANGSMYWKMFLQSPKILSGIKREHQQLEQIIKGRDIDVVISDNRYGLYTKNAYCIFITHQLFIQTGIFSGPVKKINHNYIKKFNECWIPDFEDEENNLSGTLAHGKHDLPKVKFIGPLSRFDQPCPKKKEFEFAYCAVISGPEPQRTIFEKQVTEKIKKKKLKSVIVRGLPHEKKVPAGDNQITYFNHCTEEELFKLMSKSEVVIARSGYSTIMDLYTLKKKAMLFPTPGQTEQQYLFEYHREKKMIELI